jgi:uncharacterized protein
VSGKILPMVAVSTRSRSRPIDPAIRPAIRQFLEKISRSFDVTGAVLYGSQARGDPHAESDVDLAVLLAGERGNQRFLPIARAMDAAAIDVLLETEIYISPLPIWEDEWKHPETYSNPTLLRNIAAEGIRL